MIKRVLIFLEGIVCKHLLVWAFFVDVISLLRKYNVTWISLTIYLLQSMYFHIDVWVKFWSHGRDGNEKFWDSKRRVMIKRVLIFLEGIVCKHLLVWAFFVDLISLLRKYNIPKVLSHVTCRCKLEHNLHKT
jgi:hypothetical protein